MRKEVKVDARGHISLNGVRTKGHDRYMAEEDPDGTIHLMPMVLVPAVLKSPSGPPRYIAEHEREPESRDFMNVLREHFPDAKELP